MDGRSHTWSIKVTSSTDVEDNPINGEKYSLTVHPVERRQCLWCVCLTWKVSAIAESEWDVGALYNIVGGWDLGIHE